MVRGPDCNLDGDGCGCWLVVLLLVVTACVIAILATLNRGC